MNPPPFIADAEHLGRREPEWATSAALGALAPLEIPLARHAVVVAPHPDDEVLGAGGLLQVLGARGVAIDICAMTDGEASAGDVEPAAADDLRRVRTEESEEALRRLGLTVRRHRLGLPDGEVSAHAAVLGRWLTASLDIDSLCVVPWLADGHPDHDAAGHTAVNAAAAVGAPCLQYLVWAWHWADPHGSDLPWASCRRLDLTRREAARKRWATGAFHSQTRVQAGAGPSPVLPPPVLRRFWRPWEVYTL